MDSRTVVWRSRDARCIALRLLAVGARSFVRFVHSVTRARLFLSLFLSRVSHGCPQIARNYWLLLFSRHTPHGSLALHIISTCPRDAPAPTCVLVCRFSSSTSLVHVAERDEPVKRPRRLLSRAMRVFLAVFLCREKKKKRRRTRATLEFNIRHTPRSFPRFCSRRRFFPARYCY